MKFAPRESPVSSAPMRFMTYDTVMFTSRSTTMIEPPQPPHATLRGPGSGRPGGGGGDPRAEGAVRPGLVAAAAGLLAKPPPAPRRRQRRPPPRRQDRLD